MDILAIGHTGTGKTCFLTCMYQLLSINRCNEFSLKASSPDEHDNLNALFGPSPIYTKIRDDNPTRYIGNSKVKNTMVADGCVIEGEVENCILFRGVHVGKGAVVKNCILMQDTVVADNVEMDYVITDKEVSISEGKILKGNNTFPVFIPPFSRI